MKKIISEIACKYGSYSFGADNSIVWDFPNSIQISDEDLQAEIDAAIAAEPMRQLRIQRDQLLSATDWWCVSDRTATAEQLQYRQALRDLPSTATPALDEDGNLTGVTWPTKPE